MTKKVNKSGYVAVLGRPNVGKSTLVNALVGEKVSIVTSKPQTTQLNILGILHNRESQIVFIDTPGLLSERQMKYNSKALNREAVNALSQADLVLNLSRLTTVIERHLPIQTPKYNEGMITDKDTDFRITEIMRERLMHHLRDELPYSVECQLDHFDDKKKIVMIDLMIKTQKPAHKKIIIGKAGQLLKVIATEARLEIENLLNKKVFLSTQVRSIKKGKSLRA